MSDISPPSLSSSGDPYRYGGELIHSSHDDEGLIEVVDTGDIRSLHFGTSAIQSALKQSDPQHLELDYTRRMLLPLLWLQDLSRVLVIGLGGGAVVRHIYEHEKTTMIDAIEKRSHVVSIAHSYFHLPRSKRVRIQEGDAYSKLTSLRPGYDLILLDAFDGDGPASALYQRDSLLRMKDTLSANGVLVLNMWTRKKQILSEAVDALREMFSERCCYSMDKTTGNVVLYAYEDSLLDPFGIDMQMKAHSMDKLRGTCFQAIIGGLQPSLLDLQPSPWWKRWAVR